MRGMRTATTWFGVVNLLIGVFGLAGPTVTGNRDHVINIRPGRLFGIFGMNWAHALLHVAFGVAGLVWRAPDRVAVAYMRSVAVVFGILTAAYTLMFGGRPGIHLLMGMALDRSANLVHVAWTVTGLLFGLLPVIRGGSKDEP